jgi:hypothetical protein
MFMHSCPQILKSATHQSHSDMQLESPSHFPLASHDNSNARASAHQASHSILVPASKPHSKPVSLANNKHTSAPVTHHPAPCTLTLPALTLNPIAGSQHGPPSNSPHPCGTHQLFTKFCHQSSFGTKGSFKSFNRQVQHFLWPSTVISFPSFSP